MGKSLYSLTKLSKVLYKIYEIDNILLIKIIQKYTSTKITHFSFEIYIIIKYKARISHEVFSNFLFIKLIQV